MMPTDTLDARAQVALRIFCALITSPRPGRDNRISFIIEDEIRTCFTLADTFLQIASEPNSRTEEHTT